MLQLQQKHRGTPAGFIPADPTAGQIARAPAFDLVAVSASAAVAVVSAFLSPDPNDVRTGERTLSPQAMLHGSTGFDPVSEWPRMEGFAPVLSASLSARTVIGFGCRADVVGCVPDLCDWTLAVLCAVVEARASAMGDGCAGIPIPKRTPLPGAASAASPWPACYVPYSDFVLKIEQNVVGIL